MSRTAPILSLLLAFALAPPAEADDVLAIVCQLQGQATIRTENAVRPLRLLDLLGDGERVELGEGGSLVLGLADGRRIRIGGGAVVTVAAADLLIDGGTREELDPAPLVGQVLDLPATPRPERTSAAVRIRGGATEGGLVLDPPDEAIVAIDAPTLRFEPVEGVTEYRLEVEDEATGEVVFEGRGPGVERELPTGVLVAGRSYRWRVSARYSSLLELEGEAGFLAVEPAVAALHADLQSGADEDADLVAILAELEDRLGLTGIACDRLAAAFGADAATSRLDCP